MRAFKVAAVVLSLLLVFTGCDVMYSLVGFNMFASMDKVTVPSADKLAKMKTDNPDGYVNLINDALDTGTFTSDQLPDGVTQETVVADLADIYNDTNNDPATRQAAALTAAAVATEGDPNTAAVIGGVSNLLSDAATDPTAVAAYTTNDIIGAIFPDNLSTADLTNSIADLASAADAYSSYMASGATIPDDQVQTALISLAVVEMMAATTPANDPAALAAEIEGLSTGGSLSVDPTLFEPGGAATGDFATVLDQSGLTTMFQ